MAKFLQTGIKKFAIRVVFALSLGALFVPTVRADRDDDHGRGKGHGKHKEKDDRREHGHFREGDAQIIVNYYGPRNLPPGLQKKLYRTGHLPPGWEKKVQPFPVVIERELPPICYGCGRGMIGNYAVVYDLKTRLIIDAIDLIQAIRR